MALCSRRLRGKSDPLDAQNAGRAVLSGRARARAKSGDGPVQIAWMYKLTKGSAVKARTQAVNQLKAVLVTADPDLRDELAGLNNPDLFRTCARFADDSNNDEGEEERVLQATRITLRLAGPPDRPAEELSKLPFDVVSGGVPQAVGRVIDGEEPMPAVYVTGWIKRVPIGLIGHAKGDANETVAWLLEDHMAGRLAAPDQPDPDAVVDFLAERGVRRVTRKGWYRTDAHEQVHGTEQGRERIKVVERAAMLDASEA